MKQYICDRCRCILVNPLYFKLEQTNPWDKIPNKKFHLCEECYSKFCSFLRRKDETHDKTEGMH